MLHRQRLILFMLAEAGGEATHLEITKWAFLVREETPSAGGSSFYQFVPYQFGPFSFGLFQEVAAMVRDGLIVERPNDRWSLTSLGSAEARRAVGAPIVAARGIVKRFAGKARSGLIDYVYDRHRWYTINSNIRKLAVRPVAAPAVYTAGYEGLLIDGFLNGLLRHGITRLIDVRHNPVARRYGFHKSTLIRLCGKLGIDYAHAPELGIRSEERQDLDAPGARARLFARYAASTLRSEHVEIQRVADLVAERPSVLVCMEARACDCHRSHLAEPVAALTGLPIRHLEIRP